MAATSHGVIAVLDFLWSGIYDLAIRITKGYVNTAPATHSAHRFQSPDLRDSTPNQTHIIPLKRRQQSQQQILSRPERIVVHQSHNITFARIDSTNKLIAFIRVRNSQDFDGGLWASKLLHRRIMH